MEEIRKGINLIFEAMLYSMITREEAIDKILNLPTGYIVEKECPDKCISLKEGRSYCPKSNTCIIISRPLTLQEKLEHYNKMFEALRFISNPVKEKADYKKVYKDDLMFANNALTIDGGKIKCARLASKENMR